MADSAAVTSHLDTARASVAPVALANEAAEGLKTTLTAQLEVKEQLPKLATSYVSAGCAHGVRFTHSEVTRGSMPVEAAIRNVMFKHLLERLDLQNNGSGLFAAGFSGVELDQLMAYRQVTAMVSRSEELLMQLTEKHASKLQSNQIMLDDVPLRMFRSRMSRSPCPRLIVSPEWALKVGVSGVIKLMMTVGSTMGHVFLPTPFELLFRTSRVEFYAFDRYELPGDVKSYMVYMQSVNPVPVWLLGSYDQNANFIPVIQCSMPPWYRFYARGRYDMASLLPCSDSVMSSLRYDACFDLWEQWLRCYPGCPVSAAFNETSMMCMVKGIDQMAHWSAFTISKMHMEVARVRYEIRLPGYRRCYLVRDFFRSYRPSGRAARRWINLYDTDDYLAVPGDVVDDIRAYLARNTDDTFEDPAIAIALVNTTLRKSISTLSVSANAVTVVGASVNNVEARSLVLALTVENYAIRHRNDVIISHNNSDSTWRHWIERLAEIFVDSNTVGRSLAEMLYGTGGMPDHLIRPAVMSLVVDAQAFLHNTFSMTDLDAEGAGDGTDRCALLMREQKPGRLYDSLEDVPRPVDDAIVLHDPLKRDDKHLAPSAPAWEADFLSHLDPPECPNLNPGSVDSSNERDAGSESEDSDAPALIDKRVAPRSVADRVCDDMDPAGGVQVGGGEPRPSESSKPAKEKEPEVVTEEVETPSWAVDYMKKIPRYQRPLYDPETNTVRYLKKGSDFEIVISEASRNLSEDALTKVRTQWGVDACCVNEKPVATPGRGLPAPYNITPTAIRMRTTLPSGVEPHKWKPAYFNTNCKVRHTKHGTCLCSVAYRLTGTYMHCNGKLPKRIKFGLSQEQVVAWKTVLQNNGSDAGLKAKEHALSEFIIKTNVATVGIWHEANVAYIEAGPGTGKTNLIKCLAANYAYLGVGYFICCPLSEAQSDFGTVSIPSPTAASGVSEHVIACGTALYWSAKTYTEANGRLTVVPRPCVDVLIIDEAWMCIGEYLALAIATMRPNLVLVVGDTRQNELPATMSVCPVSKVLRKAEVMAPKSDHAIHRMVFNFRNPKPIVDILNRHYYSDCPMVAMSTEPGIVRAVVGDEDDPECSDLVKTADGLPEVYYCMYPSNYTGAKMSSRHTSNVPARNTGATVLQSQGLTRRCVKVYLTARDTKAYSSSSLMIVCFSRHTHELMFVLDRKDSGNAAAFLSSMGIGLDIGMRMTQQQPLKTGFITRSDGFKDADPLEPNYRSAVGVVSTMVEPVDADNPHVNGVARSQPLDKKLRTYVQEPDAFIKPEAKRVRKARQIGNIPHALLQTNSLVETARTAISRYNLARSSITYDAGFIGAVREAAARVFLTTKDTKKLRAFWADEEYIAGMWRDYVKDLREKGTLSKAEGTSDIGDYEIIEGEFSLRKMAIYMSQKSGVKMVNNTKDFSIDKAGQGVSAFSPMLTLTYGFLMRVMNRADLLSNFDAEYDKANAHAPWIVIEHNGRNPADVAADLSSVMERRPEQQEVSICDMPQADSTIGRAEYELSYQWDLMLLAHCTDVGAFYADIAQCLRFFYSALENNRVIVPGVLSFNQRVENLSGHSATLLVTTRVNKVQLVLSAEGSQGRKTVSVVGDDGLIAATKVVFSDNPYLEAYRRYSNVRFMHTDARKDACDFVGHVVQLQGKSLVMVPSLIRRFERVVARPFKDAAEFLVTKQSILDYFVENRDKHDVIIRAAANVLITRAGLDKDNVAIDPYLALASAYWEAYESLSHWSEKDFMNMSTEVDIPIA